MACQIQTNGHDCGIFAVAFAVSIASKKDPTNLHYDTSKMRQHLIECFKKGCITQFLESRNLQGHYMGKTQPPVREKVYCHCRRTYIDCRKQKSAASDKKAIGKEPPWDLIQCDGCKEWFHRKCELWPETPEDIKWFCRICAK